MDLYRFFHPHHNPRLRNRPVRLQELSELELAAKELYRALERASVRMESQKSDIPDNLLDSSSEAIELAVELLHQIVEIHPEDSEADMKDMLEERKSAPGWEAWCNLVKERIEMLKNTFPISHDIRHSDTTSNEISSEENRSELDDSLPSVSTLIEKKTVSA
jgi:hypothetical protein